VEIQVEREGAEIVKTLYLLRGLPGSGKTTIGRLLAGKGRTYAADDYFTTLGRYKFDPDLLPVAHRFCESVVGKAMAFGAITIAVANTFIERRHMEPYRAMARQYGYHLVELTVETDLTDEELAARNEHGVPAETIARMRARMGAEDCCVARRAVGFDETTWGDEQAALWCDQHSVNVNGRGQTLPEGGGTTT
jgi:predicted kinase